LSKGRKKGKLGEVCGRKEGDEGGGGQEEVILLGGEKTGGGGRLGKGVGESKGRVGTSSRKGTEKRQQSLYGRKNSSDKKGGTDLGGKSPSLPRCRRGSDKKTLREGKRKEWEKTPGGKRAVGESPFRVTKEGDGGKTEEEALVWGN